MLVSGATTTLSKYKGHPHLGFLQTPRAGNGVGAILSLEVPWAADNSCFSGFDEARFVRMLGRISGVPGLLWVAAPDTVCDQAATLQQFDRWQPIIARHGLPAALVAQGGADKLPVPWDRLDAIFIGSPTEWKLSDEARRLCVEAKDRGKLVHVGRVNSRKRIMHLARWGCVDSVDGSGFSRWPDKKVPKGLAWVEEAQATAAREAATWAMS